MPKATDIQKLTALIRDLSRDSSEDIRTVIRGIAQTDWHMELAAFCAEVPVALVRDFVRVHDALTGKPPRAETLVNGRTVAGVQ